MTLLALLSINEIFLLPFDILAADLQINVFFFSFFSLICGVDFIFHF